MDVQLPDGTVLRGVPDGTSKADLVAKLKSNGYDTSSLAVSAGTAINNATDSLPRQIGLTARYGIEGLGNTAQVFSEPFRYVTDRLTGSVGKSKPAGALASDLADAIGLPKPETANERVIGEGTKLMAGAGGLGTAAKLASAAPGIAGNVSNFLASNPLQQVTSAAGSGLAGGASKEAGGSWWQQLLASIGGGLVGGGIPSVFDATKNAVKTVLPKPSNVDIDAQLTGLVARSGGDYSQIPEAIKQSLRAELGNALATGKEVDPAALSRLIDFKRTGLTPTRGMVSLDPVQLTQEKNLAKIAANTANGELQGLPRLENQNNAKLIENLNTLGAQRGNILEAGNRVASSVTGTQSSLRGAEQAAWNEAKNSPGYTRPISANVLSDVNAALGSEGLMPFMNPTISKYMQAFQEGQQFTPQAYRNLQSMLAREVSKGGNEGAAAGLARRILEDADLRPAGFVNNGAPVPANLAGAMRQADNAVQNSISAVDAARRATRAAYAFEDSNPLVRSVLSDGASSDPQRIAQRFIVGGTLREARDVANQVGPQGIPVIRDALLAHIKEKALNGSADEVGKFSQSAFNKALRDMGPKLEVFFSPEEIQQLQSIGRASSYAQFQPAGSAVNNSNSGALLLGRGLDMLGSVASKFPMGQQLVSDPLRNIGVTIRQRQAQDVLPGLLAIQPKQSIAQPFILPAVATGGLLASP